MDLESMTFPSTLQATRPVSRRRFLSGGAAAAGGLLMPQAALPGISGPICLSSGHGAGGGYYDESFDDSTIGAAPMDGPGERRVRMVNSHLPETYDEVFVRDGQYVPEALEKFNHFCRDWRDSTVKTMNPGLLDIAWKLSQMLNITAPWQLNSGYRSPRSNATVGGARRSYHMRGMANDLVSPQRSPGAVYAAAMKLGAGGVGRYGSFTHVDTGPVRTWRG